MALSMAAPSVRPATCQDVDREADGQALVAQVFGGQAEILMGHGAGQADDGGKALVFHGSAPGGGALDAPVIPLSANR